MNIQINCTENVRKEDLTYIGYNLEDVLKEYEETKNDYYHKKWIKGKYIWYRHLSGGLMINNSIDVTCNEKTMFFKIN